MDCDDFPLHSLPTPPRPCRYVGFGLTNGFWDIVWQTRIPENERRALYQSME